MRRHISLLLAPLFILAACETDVPVETAPLRPNYQPILIGAERLETRLLPYQELTFEEDHLQNRLNEWFQLRYQPVDAEGLLEMEVLRLDVKQEHLSRNAKVKDLWRDEPALRNTADVAVAIKRFGERAGLPDARIEATASSSITLPESMNLMEREAAIEQWTADLIQRLDAIAEAQTRQYLQPYLR